MFGTTRPVGAAVDFGYYEYTVVAAGDTSAPVIVQGPVTSNIQETSISLQLQINEHGKIHVVLVADGAAAPTVTQVKNLQAAGGGAPIASGQALSVNANTTTTFTFSALTHSTTYSIYIVVEDDVGNLSSAPEYLQGMTLVPLPPEETDVTPPSFVFAPQLVNVTTASFGVAATLEESGTVYVTVMEQGKVAPDSSQVSLGMDGEFRPAFMVLNAGFEADTEAVIPVTGLQPDKQYDVYVVAGDALNNLTDTPFFLQASTRLLIVKSSILVNNTGAPQVNLTALNYWVWADRIQAVIVSGADGVTDELGRFKLKHAAFAPGTPVWVWLQSSDGLSHAVERLSPVDDV
jgi:hypothetical protein